MRYLIIFIICQFIVEKAISCTCAPDSNVKNEIKKHDLVFVGKVISKDIIKINDTLDVIETEKGKLYDIYQSTRYKYVIEVVKIYKGKIKKNLIEVITGVGKGDCGFSFQINVNYVIYGDYRNQFIPKGEKVTDYIYTDICTRTCEINDEEVQKIEMIKRGRSVRNSSKKS